MLEAAGKIRGQRLDRGLRHARMDRAHAGRVMRGAAVGEVVAVDRGQHHVFEIHQRDRIGDVARFGMIEPALRIAGADRAEPARARAHLAHQHQGRGAAAPAFADVRAFRFGADRVQLVAAHDVTHFLELAATRQPHAQPRRLALDAAHQAVGVRADAVLDRAHAVGGDVFAAALGRGRGFVAGHRISLAGQRLSNASLSGTPSQRLASSSAGILAAITGHNGASSALTCR